MAVHLLNHNKEMITGYYMTKEFVQSNMSNLLEDIRRNCISINLGVVDTMWVCDVMNNEKMGSLIAFAYESPQCDTPVDALYDAYTWLIKNGKIELDEEEREFADNIDSYRKEVDVAYQKGYKEGVKAALENKLSESAKILLYND